MPRGAHLKPAAKVRYCARAGHDTWACGRDSYGCCLECRRERTREHARRRREASGEVPPNVGGPGARPIPNLSATMRTLGVGRRELAVYAGLTTRTVCNLEAGKPARPKTRRAVLDALAPLVRERRAELADRRARAGL